MKKVIIKLNNYTIGESEMTFSEITEAENAGFTIYSIEDGRIL